MSHHRPMAPPSLVGMRCDRRQVPTGTTECLRHGMLLAFHPSLTALFHRAAILTHLSATLAPEV